MKINSKKLCSDITPESLRIPRIYFAGKISQNCWRQSLIEGLRNHHWRLGPLVQQDFICVGPFFISCDHGCYHNHNTHGTSNPQQGACPQDIEYGPAQVAELCRNTVAQADLVFCFINSKTCYGTIAEIERAHVLRIPVVIAFASGIAKPRKNDFWFVTQPAMKAYFNVTQAQLPKIFQLTLQEMS